MINPNNNAQDEIQELSPEAQETIKKAKMALGSGLLIMIAGIAAVLGVVIFRLNSIEPEGAITQANINILEPGSLIADINLPNGAEVVSSSATPQLISITYRLNGQTILRVVNATSGAILQDITLN